MPVEPAGKWEYLGVAFVFLALLLFAQWIFLRPRRRGWIVELTKTGQPMKTAVCVAAFMAALLSIGLVSMLLEIPDWWSEIMETPPGFVGVYGGILVAWIAWAWVFYRYWQDADHYTRLSKMVRALLTGSLVEFLVAVPVHVLVARQRSCYCARGSYTALIFAGTVLMWAFGPGIILLYMRERHRRACIFPICDTCGYDLRGDEVGRCPECGTPRT